MSLPGRLSTTVDFLAVEHAVAVRGLALALVENEEEARLTDTFPWLKKCVERVASQRIPVNFALRSFNRLVHSTLPTHKEAVVKLGGYDDLSPLEDWDLALRLTSLGDVYVLPVLLGIKRQHGMNYSKAHPNSQYAFQIIRDRHGLEMESLPKTSTL